MNDKYVDELLKQYPNLEEVLDYYIFVPQEVYETRYGDGDSQFLSYNLVYDLITSERGYSYVYALFYEFIIPGDNFCVGYVDGEDIYSTEITRAKLARSIRHYLSEGRMNFEGVYKDRVDELLEKTSTDAFYETYDGEDFHRIIDGDDVTIPIIEMIDFLSLPTKEFQSFFDDLDLPYKGVSKTYFVYMVNAFFLSSAAFDDYVFPNNLVARYELLGSNQIIDIEALNKVKKTLDSTIDRVKINDELRQSVLGNLDTSSSDLEKAIYIYIKLCKLLSYDEEFYAVNQRGYVALKHENPERIYTITPKNNRAVCYEFNSIFAKLLDELNIKFITTSKLNGIYRGHTSLMFRVGKFLVNADSVESILKNDLLNAKLNNPLDGLRCVNKYKGTREAFADILSKVYKIVAAEENVAAKVEERETFADILREYEGCINETLDLDSKLAVMIDKVIHTGVQGVDSIAYLLQLRKIIFSREEREKNIKISIVRDNVTASSERVATVSAIFTINKVDMYVDIFNNQYYFFHPNYPLVPVSIIEIQELFEGNMLEYIGDKYLEIPGLSSKEACVDDQEIKSFK